MSRSHLIAAGSAFFALVASVFGQPIAAPTPTFTVTPAVTSQYMFRGVRLAGPSFEPAIEYDRGGLALGVWANFPVQDKVPGQSDPEIDPYGWYKIAINDSVSVQPGFTWYTFVNAEPRNGFYRMTFEPSLAVNWAVLGVTFTPKLYYDVVLAGPTYELSAAYALPLKAIGTELDLSATAGTYKWKSAVAEQSSDVKGWGDYWLVGLMVPYQVATNTRIMVAVSYTEGSGNYFKQGSLPKYVNPGAVGHGVVTLSYARTF